MIPIITLLGGKGCFTFYLCRTVSDSRRCRESSQLSPVFPKLCNIQKQAVQNNVALTYPTCGNANCLPPTHPRMLSSVLSTSPDLCTWWVWQVKTYPSPGLLSAQEGWPISKCWLISTKSGVKVLYSIFVTFFHQHKSGQKGILDCTLRPM